MSDLSQLTQEVAGLVKNESTPLEFRNAYNHIEEASKTAKNSEIVKLRGILSNFRGKISNLIILKPIKVKARDLADTLMLNTLEERITRINARNEVLKDLTTRLETQIDKANNDADLLKQIKGAVDKATKTVIEVKSLVEQLTVTDASIKDVLTSLIERLSNISSIFKPQDNA